MFTFYIIFIESSERKFIRLSGGMLVKFYRGTCCANTIGCFCKRKKTKCSAKVSALFIKAEEVSMQLGKLGIWIVQVI